MRFAADASNARCAGGCLRKGMQPARLLGGQLPEVAAELLALAGLHVRRGRHAVHQRDGRPSLHEVVALVPQEGCVVDVAGVQTCDLAAREAPCLKGDVKHVWLNVLHEGCAVPWHIKIQNEHHNKG